MEKAEHKKIVVYTAITNGYDDLSEVNATSGVRYIAFVEDVNIQSRGWELRKLFDKNTDATRRARRVKILPQEYLDAEISLWVDGNILIPKDFNLNILIEKYLDKTDMVTCLHPVRNCMYEEAKAVKLYGLDDATIVDEQTERYRNRNYPMNNGLAETNIMLRRHTDSIERHSMAWWDELRHGSRRDQLSFDFVCRQSSVPYDVFSQEDRNIFNILPHIGSRIILSD